MNKRFFIIFIALLPLTGCYSGMWIIPIERHRLSEPTKSQSSSFKMTTARSKNISKISRYPKSTVLQPSQPIITRNSEKTDATSFATTTYNDNETIADIPPLVTVNRHYELVKKNKIVEATAPLVPSPSVNFLSHLENKQQRWTELAFIQEKKFSKTIEEAKEETAKRGVYEEAKTKQLENQCEDEGFEWGQCITFAKYGYPCPSGKATISRECMGLRVTEKFIKWGMNVAEERFK